MSSVVCVQAVYLQKAFAFTYKSLYVQKPLRTKAFTYKSLYVQKPLRTKAFTHKSLYPCTYYFSTTLAMRAALKSKRTTLLALLSFPRAIWPVPRWRAAWHDSWAKFPEKGGGCVVFLVALRVFSDSNDTELRTVEMTLPLCHVKSVRHRGTGPTRVTSLERCRASFEPSLLDVGRCNSFSRFLNTSVYKKERKQIFHFAVFTLVSFVRRTHQQVFKIVEQEENMEAVPSFVARVAVTCTCMRNCGRFFFACVTPLLLKLQSSNFSTILSSSHLLAPHHLFRPTLLFKMRKKLYIAFVYPFPLPTGR